MPYSSRRHFVFAFIGAGFIALVAAFIAFFVYAKNDDGGNGVCPDLPVNEAQRFVSSHADRKLKQPRVEFIEHASYSQDLAQWSVPYRVNGHRYIARINCAGWVLDNVGPYD